MNPEAEVETTEESPEVQMEDIHPTMTIVDRERALDEIMKVLRGEQ